MGGGGRLVYAEGEAGQGLGLCLTGRVRGSRLARRNGRSVRKRMNSNIAVVLDTGEGVCDAPN